MKSNLILTAALSLSLCATSTAQTLPAYLPTDGLVGWWPFNGNANDESGNGNNGLVDGATLTEDRFGNAESAYSFYSNNDFIEISTASGSFDNSSFSFSLWRNSNESPANPNGGPNVHPAFFSRLNTGGPISGPGVDDNFVLYQNGGSFSMQSSNGQAGFGFSSGIQFGNSVWDYIVLTYSPSEGYKLFKNAVLEYSQSASSSGQISYDPFPIRLGRSKFTYWKDYSGLLDDIAIYNRALTPEEITTLYTGEPINPPTTCNPLPSNLQNGLVGYWPFCGNANDESGNGNDGTVNGATLTEDRFGVANAAYSFDGLNSIISINHDSSISVASNASITVQAWALKSGSLTTTHILGKRINGCGSMEYQFGYCESNCTFTFSEGIGFGCSGAYAYSGVLLENEIWNHYVGTFDGSSWKIYLNGDLIGTLNSSTINSNLGNLIIGGSGSCQKWEGIIDDIAIWNRALTPEEVQQLYTLNACTFTIYDTVTVTETIYDTVSVSVSTTDTLIINTLITAVEPAQENTFLVYPNPASTQITINNGNVAILGGYTMRITNSLGQDVYNQNITQPQVTLDLSSWSGNGLYVLYIVDPQQNIVAVKQIVLQ